ncbi:MAG: enoyl-CoA hydratase/isomerase family protein [Alphaproteobacteria bacterium]|nr:enoyl-CoA hydratase/isomerase family protein [Alphaproteobacteria bacterium]
MDYADYQHLLIERRETVLRVTLNRPEVLNAVNKRLHYELSRIWDDVMYDDETDLVVLTGAGRAFSAGGDYPWLLETVRNRDMRKVSSYEAKRVVFNLLDCEKPVICRMNGDAIGLGATVALYCDMIIAAESARIGDPHVRAGLVAGDGGAVVWPQLIGFARAKYYLMTGDLIAAPEAAQMGLITRAVPADELDAAVDAVVGKLARGAQKAIRWTKVSANTALKQIAHATFDTGMAFELMTQFSDDHAEAVTAFVDKRKPRFTGS